MLVWYHAANTVPITATPTAPPVWRVVSLTADPTPALLTGSDPMIDSVTGAVVKPKPKPITNRVNRPLAKPDMIRSEPEQAVLMAMSVRPNMTTRLVPNRLTRPGANGDASIIPTATGVIMIPALSGLYPSRNWKYCVIRNVAPNDAANVSVIVAEAAENRGFLKKRTSSMGFGLWASHAANPTTKTAPTTMGTSTRGEPQPRSGPSITP